MAINIDGDGLIALGGTASTQGRVRLAEDTDNGTNFVALQAPAAIAADVTFTLPAADGTANQVLKTDGSGNLGFAAPGGITSATAQASTSGTSIDFTGIPASVKLITVAFEAVSTNGTSNVQFQLGDAGGVETSGYAGQTYHSNTFNSALSAGFLMGTANSAVTSYNGILTLVLIGSNKYAATIIFGRPGGSDAGVTGGSKQLSDTLTTVRLTTVNGTDTFDAGSINILFE